MTYVFNVDRNSDGTKYLRYFDKDNCNETTKVKTFLENTQYIGVRIKNTDNQSILVIATIGRDLKPVLSVQKDGSNDANNDWNIIAPTIQEINDGICKIEIENLEDDVTVTEI
jgi:hypothetical protein